MLSHGSFRSRGRGRPADLIVILGRYHQPIMATGMHNERIRLTDEKFFFES